MFDGFMFLDKRKISRNSMFLFCFILIACLIAFSGCAANSVGNNGVSANDGNQNGSVLKTCAELNGFICTENAFFIETFLDSSDSSSCCPVQCSEKEEFCAESIPLKSCLQEKPFYCNEKKIILENCSICGCIENQQCDAKSGKCHNPISNEPIPVEQPKIIQKFVFDVNGTEYEELSLIPGQDYNILIEVHSENYGKKISSIHLVDSNPSNTFESQFVDCGLRTICNAKFNAVERWAGNTDFNLTVADSTGVEYHAVIKLTSTAVCGNNVCEIGENPGNCASDCALNVCGNHSCESNENPFGCPTDCSPDVCGNNVCDIGENPNNCADCKLGLCGNHLCESEENKQNCFSDCNSGCGNGVCEKNENPTICLRDCPQNVCGNNVCEMPNETLQNCPNDCNGICGNNVCEQNENVANCGADCHSMICGNNTCESGENPSNCKVDCPVDSCGNNVCETNENLENCNADCHPWVCGNNTCEGAENPVNCSKDCKVNICGNNACDSDETIASCPKDCHSWTCGNNLCEIGENPQNCLTDCTFGICGNRFCDQDENVETCQMDCS